MTTNEPRKLFAQKCYTSVHFCVRPIKQLDLDTGDSILSAKARHVVFSRLGQNVLLVDLRKKQERKAKGKVRARARELERGSKVMVSHQFEYLDSGLVVFCK